MKNWKKAAVGTLCVVSLLAGCGTQTDPKQPDENGDAELGSFTPESVRETNAPAKLLEKHDTVTVSLQGSDQDGNETYTAKVQYTRDEQGRLVMASHYTYTPDSAVGEDEFFAQACFSNEGHGVYLNTMSSEENLSMNCYPGGEYETYILDILPAAADGGVDAEETIDGCSEQDGAVLLSTTTRYAEIDDYYYTTIYYIDPSTGELLAMSVTDYSKDESGEASSLGTTLYDWSYDEPYAPEKELAAEAFNSDEACALTLVYAPGTDAEETQEISVRRGTNVTFSNSTGCQLYADAALAQPLDDTRPIDTSGESMTVYVVPQGEN